MSKSDSCVVMGVTVEGSGALTVSFEAKALSLAHWKLMCGWEGGVTRRAWVRFQELLSASGA